jgi:hypothetical protein
MTFLPETPDFRLVSGLATNPIFHGVYLQKYNDPQDEFFTTYTWICFLNGISIPWSESLYKKIYSENGEMTCK